MKQYHRINNLCGWIVFAIAAFVYLSTIEPTGSFWDCGEFIAASVKMQIGHPPGAPLFLMLGRVFSLFAGDNVRMVSVMINSLSALMSAFCILFLFWTITALARKVIIKGKEATTGELIAVMGAGAVGALAYTFSDSFWFSAVEGEVYASSSFFTAIVFWAMFKWEAVADERHANRWIILIAYLMGLSIGVHLLNLLTIPSLAFIYYFRKYKPTTGGVIATGLAGVAILGIVQFGVISELITIASKFELFFVNSFGMPFWSGFMVFLLLFVAALVYGLMRTTKKNQPLWNLSLLCLAFIVLGYSSYTMIVVRSQANPPMDENDPENVFNLSSYINREQYGDRPLFYGQYYNAQQTGMEEGSMQYAAVQDKATGKDKYVETGRRISPTYDNSKSTFFPRMFSAQENHVSAYKEWAGVEGDATPTFGQNLKFFFSYQVVHMYWRYFMWNFAGRQNDIQGHGGINKGNWISGIKAIDAMRLGPQDNLPDSMLANKGRNAFYFLPLILGLIGLIWHFKRDKHDAWTVMLLYFFTGMAIVLYLNQTPYQPRERDYAYAGSFYAFAIWIGLGVAALIEKLKNKMPEVAAAGLTTAVCLVAVPAVMAKDGWDDHDRSHRFTSRDFAWDYLQSCAPNAIIFTNGDNDTFPLWYAQDVEGVRPDIRIINLSLLNTDWYIDQMKKKAYASDPIPFSLTHDKYMQGTRDYVPFYDRQVAGYTDLKEVVDFIGNDGPEYKVKTQGGSELSYFPTKKFFLKVDKDAVMKSGTVRPDQAKDVVDTLFWDLQKTYLMKADMMILDLIANNNWKRPIYFAVTVGNDSYLNLEPYFQLEGLAYRLVPIKGKADSQGQTGRVDTKNMYANMMGKFEFGNMKRPDVYLDQTNMGMTMNFRNNFSRLSESLLDEGKRDSAITVLDKMNEEMPDKTVPFNVMMLRPIELYFAAAQGPRMLGQDSTLSLSNMELPEARKKHSLDMAIAITKRMADIYENDLAYYYSLKGTEYYKFIDRDANQALAIFNELIRMSKAANQDQLVKELEPRFKKLEDKFNSGSR